MELKLVVLAGAKQGLEIPLKKDKFLIGRAKECSLRAGSEAISRRHCAIVRAGGSWTVRDLGSRNGTYVNDQRITEAVPLTVGDQLRVGPLHFRVDAREAAKPAAPPNAAPAKEGQSRKQPPVKDVADVVARTISRSDDSATEEDVSRWLLGLADPKSESTMKETLSFHLEDTNAHGRITASTVEDVTAAAEPAPEQQTPESAPEAPDDKSGGWSLFKRGKAPAAKQKPGKLPPRAGEPSKDSREAAADILREMTRRR